MFSAWNDVMVAPSRPTVADGISMRVHVSAAGTVALMKVHELSPSIGGESSCTFISATVPAADTWTRIEIPSATVGLDGATITSFQAENIGSQGWLDRSEDSRA